MKKILLLVFLFLGVCTYSFSNKSFKKIKECDCKRIAIDTLYMTANIQRSCTSGLGTIKLFGNGGTAPYEFSINGSPYSSKSNYTDLSPGNYIARVKDANGNISFDSTITIPPILSATFTINNQVVSVTALGVTAPYQYSFDNGITYENSNNYFYATPGNYSFLVKDAYRCVVQQNFVIPTNSLLNLTATNTNALCSTLSFGTITATATGGQAPYTYAIDNGVNQATNIFSNVFPGSHLVSVTDAVGDTKKTNVTITAPSALLQTTAVSNQIISVNASGGTPPYRYAIDGVNYQTGNTFALPIGDYTTFVLDANNCYSTLSFYKTPAPKINGSSLPKTVNVVVGKKLKDIPIDGGQANINWYLTAGPNTAKIKQTARIATESKLDPDMLVQEGVTYYASQIVDGFESGLRLAITTTFAPLGTEDFVLTDFKYYPNPIKNTLTVSNSAIIDEIAITSLLGKTILTKKINNLSADVDLSGLSNGVYFLKVKSEGKEKIVKILK
jgi:Secretion system C-terminal sorting domain/SprB repeat